MNLTLHFESPMYKISQTRKVTSATYQWFAKLVFSLIPYNEDDRGLLYFLAHNCSMLLCTEDVAQPIHGRFSKKSKY
ncbi:unnamed protein product [Acanthoscelides obtectus]|uniref:Uncharacterized protein n=1 Tax=Acanthoscelides obtectus TaxID=200917 RepID=A0A9P0PPY7_ACAOB|nr:unnamed protein product [Acanthoscelides obtectus]CAK1633048.1 hypothetical protein AOBTE_LOCUS7904 [Acanthoscelides obtectus]